VAARHEREHQRAAAPVLAAITVFSPHLITEIPQVGSA
jgi:hypothetical protein